MRVANIILTSENGGAEQVFIDYCEILKTLGHDVMGILKTDAPYANEFLKLEIELRKIPNNFGYYDIFAVKKLQKILQKDKIQVVFAHAGRSIVIARKAIRNIKDRKIFLVAVNHSMNVKRSIGADIVLSVNKQIFYRTIDYGQKVDASFVIPNAIDISDVVECTPRLSLEKKDKITIGVMGRLDKIKGFDLAIMAIKRLNSISSDKAFFLKLAGSGVEESYLRDLTIKLGLEDKVEFCGWVKDKKSFFDSIDLFALTSKRETFGLVLLEAMKHFKPIISTDSDGPKEILRSGIDALIISSNKEVVLDQFCEAVLKVVSEFDLANQLTANSFTRLKEKFSLIALKKRITEIIGIIPKLNQS